MKEWDRKLTRVEERTCFCCGKTWVVRERTYVHPSHPRVFCDDCLKNLPKDKLQKLYREHTGNFHYEKRVCINCGLEWEVQVENSYKHKRVKYFCENCNASLDESAKKKIKKAKVEGYHEKQKQQKRDSHKRTIIHCLWKRAYDRAQKYGYAFNITEDDIIIPELCPILEVPFVLGEKGNYEYTPSLDRIINELGYIKGNVRVITKKANSMKNSATQEELEKFCKNILRYSLNNKEKELIESEDKEPQS